MGVQHRGPPVANIQLVVVGAQQVWDRVEAEGPVPALVLLDLLRGVFLVFPVCGERGSRALGYVLYTDLDSSATL